MKTMIRRCLCAMLAVLCLGGMPMSQLLMPSAYAAARETIVQGETYVVKVRRLNVRSGPGTKNKVVAKLKKGTEVTMEKTEKGWCYVKYAKGNGYVDGKFLKKKSGDSGIVTFTDTGNTYTTTRRVRFRAKPSSKGKVLGKLDKGTSVTVEAKKGKWSQITHNERKVWIPSKYLKKVK